MRRPFATHAKIVERRDNAASKQMSPHMIDCHARCERMVSSISHRARSSRSAGWSLCRGLTDACTRLTAALGGDFVRRLQEVAAMQHRGGPLPLP